MNWFQSYFPCWFCRIMQHHREGSSMQTQALETLQDRLREAEVALRREQDSYREMQVMSYFTVNSRLKTWKF